ncbi:CatB-related O-acetyltransferase [Mesorhizobium sp. WSM4887]|nr:CatB-related O-acetyltransferase [Mesorhizobium sp. WSM4887]
MLPSKDAPLTVGSFCSIAGNVTIMCDGQHSTNSATSYPININLLKRPEPVQNGGRKRGVIIGHDVWICHGAVIISGVSIGHGAVIGTNAVVTKDVPPYAVVGGVPAGIIRYRFPKEIVEKLLTICWWDWDDDKIKSEADALTGSIDTFISRHFVPAQSPID